MGICRDKDRENNRKLAEQIFIQRLGIDPKDESFQMHWESADRQRTIMEKELELQYIVKSYKQNYLITEDSLILDGYRIEIDGFQNLDFNKVTKIVAYMISVSGSYKKEENLLETLYRDMWENAYLDAIRWNIIIEQKEEDMDVESFAPGLSDMKLCCMKELYHLLHGEEIGVTISDQMILSPIKSCAGFFVIHRDKFLKTDFCSTCKAKGKFCQYCFQRKDLKNETNLFHGK